MRLLVILALLIGSTFSTPLVAGPKPVISISADGFPAGHDTPEGAAADLARAFINKDVQAFEDVCLRPYGVGGARKEYEQFLQETASTMREEKARKPPSPEGPKAIGKVFAARHLSANGPASFGYAAHSFQEVMFVDVDVCLHNGTRQLSRRLTIKDRDGKWYAHPTPSVSPVLSMGLNDESPSTKDFSEAYVVKRK